MEETYMGYSIRRAEVDYAQFSDVYLVRLPSGEDEPFSSVEEAKRYIRRIIEAQSLNASLDAIFAPALFGR